MNTSNSFFSKSRVETFSDGVFAIIVTLLVLEIKVPHIEDHFSSSELVRALVSLLPKVISWMLSFFMVCVIWVNHHRILEQLNTITHKIFWHNAHLLLWCSFIPFPTALIGDYPQNSVALLVFGLIMTMMGLAFSLMRLTILKQQYVFKDDVNIEYFKMASVRSLIFGPGLYLTGAIMSLINSYLSFAVFAFIPVYFIFFSSTKVKEN